MSPVVLTSPLFTVPVWTAVASTSEEWLPQLVSDIEELLRTRAQDPRRCSGNQTLPELQNRGEPHWTAFFDWLTAVFQEVASTAPEDRYQRYELRSWALRVDSASAAKDLQYGPERLLTTHNHAPALLTSVFTCELPVVPPAELLPTIFHNPVTHANCPWQPRIMPVVPAVGKVVVFPGWLEHSVPVSAPIPPGQRRITINTDYFPDFG